MNSTRMTRAALLLGLLLVLALAAGASAQNSGSGQARWAALMNGVTPDDLTRDNDFIVAAFDGSGSVGPHCFIPGDVAYTRGDALFLIQFASGPCWIPWFDATNSGLRGNVDINAMQDECSDSDPACDMYLSFTPRTNVPGVGKVEPQDVVLGEWVPESIDSYDNWQLVFDGSDVGLTQGSEKIDGLYVFDTGEEPAELGCLQLGLVSTAGAYRVPDQWGGVIRGGGEDVLGFCGWEFGPHTAGYWFLYHDGSAEGAPANALIGLDHQDGRQAYARFEFLTKGWFDADTAQGDHSMVFNYFGQTGEYAGPTFDFRSAGATDRVDSFSVHHHEE